MTTTMNVNGRTRKSLADQIDRLDAILARKTYRVMERRASRTI